MTAVPINRSSASAARRRLLDLMRQVGFGHIEGLVVMAGEPVFRPGPRIVREVKFGGEPTCQGARDDDFVLKAQVVELFHQLDQIGDGRIARLEIKHGLPFRMNFESETGGTAA